MDLCENLKECLIKSREDSFTYVDPFTGEYKKDIGKSYLGSAAAYMVVDEKGRIYQVTSGPCHGDMKYAYDALKDKAKFVATSLQDWGNIKKANKDKYVIPYLQWLMNESPFREPFITKDPEEVLEDGVAMLSTDFPSNVLMGSLIAFRVCYESQPRMELWKDLVDLGVNPNLAYLLPFTFTKVEGGDLRLNEICGDNTSLDGRYTLSNSCTGNFVNGVWAYVDKKTFSESRRYQQTIHKSWCNKTTKDYEEHSKIRVDLINAMAGIKNTSSNNPFSVVNASTNRNTFRYRAALPIMAAELIKRFPQYH